MSTPLATLHAVPELESVPRKAITTLTAKAACNGYEVHELADGTYLVCRWNMSRACPDIRALQAFLRMLGIAA